MSATRYWSPSGVVPSLPDSLSAIWEVRQMGRVSEAYDGYLELCLKWGVKPNGPPASSWAKLNEAGLRPAEIVEFLLLDVSFLRQRLEIGPANARLAEIQRLAESFAVEGNFPLLFQSGLNALFKADYSIAFERFLSAKRYARNEREYHYTFFNGILCLENLGYDYRRQLAEFERSYREFADRPWTEPIRHQYEALRVRTALGEGDTKTLQGHLTRGVEGTQTAYFLAWLCRLPHFQFTEPHSLEALLVTRPEGHLVPFRLRTLKGLLLQSDLSGAVRLSDRIERLYLWVWRWLALPEASTLEKVLQWRSDLGDQLSGTLTPKDFLFLENSLRWIGLFSGAADRDVRAWLAPFAHGESTAPLPLLEYERLALDYFVALRDGNHAVAADTRTVLELHPGCGDPIFLLPGLVTGSRPAKALANLGRSLGEVTARAATDQAAVVVDLLERTVVIRERGKAEREVRTESLSRLVGALHGTSSLPVETILNACFDIRRYDPSIHDPKLSNLLHRANQMLAPYFRVSRRNGRVYGEMIKGELRVYGDNSHTTLLLAHPRTHETLGRGAAEATARREVSSVAARSGEAPRGWVRRSELESFLGISRSSALRKIEGWKARKLLERKGVGKASRYKISPELQRLLVARSPGGIP